MSCSLVGEDSEVGPLLWPENSPSQLPPNRRHFALGSGCRAPKMLPSVSLKYASQPTPGTGIFGIASTPPLAVTALTVASTDGTPTVQTKALTHCPSAGAG